MPMLMGLNRLFPIQANTKNDKRIEMLVVLWGISTVFSLRFRMGAILLAWLGCGVEATAKRYLIHTNGENWNTAWSDCVAYGGTLASIRSQSENDALFALLSEVGFTEESFWIGVYKAESNDFVWSDCLRPISVEYTQWDTSLREPSWNGNCVKVNKQNQLWLTSSCQNSHPYVCEKPAACEFKGDEAGVTGPPNVLTTAISTFQGCKTKCDGYLDGQTCHYIIYSTSDESCSLYAEKPAALQLTAGSGSGYFRKCVFGNTTNQYLERQIATDRPTDARCVGITRAADAVTTGGPGATEASTPKSTKTDAQTAMAKTTETHSSTAETNAQTSLPKTAAIDSQTAFPKTTAIETLTSLPKTTAKGTQTSLPTATAIDTQPPLLKTTAIDTQPPLLKTTASDNQTPMPKITVTNTQTSTPEVTTNSGPETHSGNTETVTKTSTTVQVTASEGSRVQSPTTTDMAYIVSTPEETPNGTTATALVSPSNITSASQITAITTVLTEAASPTAIFTTQEFLETTMRLPVHGHSSLSPDKSSSTYSPNTVSLGTSNDDKCYCPCYSHFFSPEQRESFIQDILETLSIDKKTTSAHVRTKTSASDTRPSATVVGSTGLVFLLIAILGIVFLDFTTLFRDLKVLSTNIKQLFRREMYINRT